MENFLSNLFLIAYYPMYLGHILVDIISFGKITNFLNTLPNLYFIIYLIISLTIGDIALYYIGYLIKYQKKIKFINNNYKIIPLFCKFIPFIGTLVFIFLGLGKLKLKKIIPYIILGNILFISYSEYLINVKINSIGAMGLLLLNIPPIILGLLLTINLKSKIFNKVFLGIIILLYIIIFYLPFRYQLTIIY